MSSPYRPPTPEISLSTLYPHDSLPPNLSTRYRREVQALRERLGQDPKLARTSGIAAITSSVQAAFDDLDGTAELAAALDAVYLQAILDNVQNLLTEVLNILQTHREMSGGS